MNSNERQIAVREKRRKRKAEVNMLSILSGEVLLAR
jgi:hypothetical protein